MFEQFTRSSSGRVYNGMKNIKDERKDEADDSKGGEKLH
jgi:hypothetical protein